jgi:fatty acid amide hydrolase 2
MTPLTERSAIDLAAAIRRREVTSREVVEAHIERLSRQGPRINALVADRFSEAREEADAADRLRDTAEERANPGALPPLLGVPFTVKETISVKGMPNAAGVLARRDHRVQKSAPAVQRLIQAGAIPVGVTNTSELTLWIESNNRLYGRTNNPFDPSRTAGGSSGGEGAAVGSGGSPFGLASDIAGSIRIPAFFCGVFGHKPSSGLVPNTGLWPPSTGSSGKLLSTGPLARRGEDLMPVLRIIAGPDGEDPSASEMTLGDPAEVDLSRLTVTLVGGASRWPMAPVVRDARDRAARTLLTAGVTLRRVRLPALREAVLPYLATLQTAAAGPDARTTTQLLEESGEARPTWGTLLRRSYRHSITTRFALALDMLPDTTSSPRQRRLIEKGAQIAEELREAIGDGVLLHPAHPRPAPRHGRTLGRPWLMAPASIFNLAGVPVTEVPLGLSSRGLPLGVQVAAPHGQDHVSIAVALELERVLGGWHPPAMP